MWVTHKGRVYYSTASFDRQIGKRTARVCCIEFGNPTVLYWWCNCRDRQIVRIIDRWKLGRFVGSKERKRK